MTPHPHRFRFLRFRLRTLLVFFTALSLWLGWHTHQTRRQHAIVEYFKSRGGGVWYDYQIDDTMYHYSVPDPAPEPEWLLKLLGIDCFHEVGAVDLFGVADEQRITDADLEKLAQLRGLKKAILRRTRQVTSAGLRSLGRIRTMEFLSLGHPAIRSQDVRHLQSLHALAHLDIGTPLGDDGLRELAHLAPLKVLRVSSEGATDVGVRSLRALPRLELLYLWGDYRVGSVFEELRQANPKLGIDDGSFAAQKFRSAETHYPMRRSIEFFERKSSPADPTQ